MTRQQQSYKSKFKKLPFKIKLLFIFTITITVTLLTTNLTLYFVLLSNIQSSLQIANNHSDLFEKLSTTQVSQALAKYVFTTDDLPKSHLQFLYQTYQFFSKDKSIYASLETPNNSPIYNNIPPLTSTFLSSKYTTGIYFYSQNSTFHNDPFLDQVLSYISIEKPDRVVRISIFYWNQTYPNDMMVRIMPATQDFIIPDPMIVVNRSLNIPQGIIKRSQNYKDQYSKKLDKRFLFSQKIIINPVDKPGFKIMIQKQLLDGRFSLLTKFIYYLPTTTLVALIKNQKTNLYELYGNSSEINYNLTPFSQPGYHSHIVQNGTVIMGNCVGFQLSTPIENFQDFTYNNNTQFRFIILTDRNDTNAAQKSLQIFLNNLYFSILISLTIFSLAIVILVLGTMINFGDRVKDYFQKIIHLINEFLIKSEKYEQIISQLRLISSKGILKDFKNRIIKLIEGIIFHRNQINNYGKQIECQNRYFLNISNRQFQKKMRKNDYQILDAVIEQIK